MAFQNTNNDNKRKTKSTRGIQFYNDNEQLGSTIVLGYWDIFANIKIHPMLPKEKRTVQSKFDYDNSVGILLPIEKINDFKEALKEVCGYLIDGNYRFDPVGVATARGDNLIIIEPITSKYEDIEDFDGICVTIYNGIDGSGIAQNELTYTFNKSSYIKSYNAKSGSYEKSTPFEGQFMIFCKYIEKSLDALTMAYTHAQASHDLWYKDSVKDSLYQLKQKAGITSGNGGNSYSGGYNNNAFGGGSSSNFPVLNGNTFNENNIVNGGVITGDRLNLDD